MHPTLFDTEDHARESRERMPMPPQIQGRLMVTSEERGRGGQDKGQKEELVMGLYGSHMYEVFENCRVQFKEIFIQFF